jgi:excisionase family DNA binding protein
MDTPKENELLTMSEAMAILRVSRSTVYRFLDRGELSGYKVARRWVFDQKDLKDFLAARRVDSSHRSDAQENAH